MIQSSENQANNPLNQQARLTDLLDRCGSITNKANATRVREYLYEAINACKPSTLASRLDALLPLAEHLGDREWEALERTDIIATISGHTFRRGSHHAIDPQAIPPRGLAASTKYQWAIHMQTFYKWLLATDETPRPFKRLPFTKHDALAERARKLALRPDEIRQILAGAQCPRDRFLIVFLIETGFRASEAAAIRLSDMERRDHGIWIKLPADAPGLKTGPRKVDVPMICATPAYERWLAEHPTAHQPGARLFVTLSPRSYGQPMSGRTISDAVVRCARRAGIRHVHAHMLRHTSATLKVAKGMEHEVIRLIHGWTEKSSMLSYYADVEGHFKDLVLKAHNLQSDGPELLDIMGAHACGLCGARNQVTDAACKRCGTHLSQAGQAAEEKHRKQQILNHVAAGAVATLRSRLYNAVAKALGHHPRREVSA